MNIVKIIILILAFTLKYKLLLLKRMIMFFFTQSVDPVSTQAAQLDRDLIKDTLLVKEGRKRVK